MKIKSIVVDNIKAIEHAELSPGALTVIRGANATGKSSLLDAIRQPFAGGHDPGLIRQGAKRGEVTIRLDNGATIELRITPKSTSLVITDAEGREVPAPKRFIEGLAPVLSVDPGRLLDPSLKQKDIAGELLEAIPIALDAREVDAAVDGNWWRTLYPTMAASVAECESNPLGVIERVRKECYERRTIANREAREADGHEQQLRKSLPAGEVVDWKAELAAKHEESNQVEAQIREAMSAVDAQLHRELRAIDEEIQRRIDELWRERAARRDAAKDEASGKIAEIAELAKPERARIAEELGAIKQKGELAELIAITRKQITAAVAKIKASNAQVEAQSRAIEALDRVKASKLEALPIPGLTWDGAQFLVDGVCWEHVNTARRIDVVLQLAVLKAGDLPLIVLDNCEHLDAEGMAALEAGAAGLNLQVVAARVDDAALSIERVA